MSVPPEIADEVRRWVEKAEHDLLAAEHGLVLADRGLTEIVCFHCQQAAEKYLKAVLVFNQANFPKTHDLRLLLDMARQVSMLALDSRDVLPLNRYAVEGRYPGDWEAITKEDAENAIRTARSVREAVQHVIPEGRGLFPEFP